MKSSKGIILAIFVFAGLGLAGWFGLRGLWGQPPSYDKLSADDRQAFQQRFDKEIWPLLERNGKDGCVGCHNGNGNSLKFTGVATKDFPKLLKDGFFIPGDDGSLLGRIIDKDEKRRMPRGKRDPWTHQEIETLQVFVADLDKKQKK